MSRVRVGDIRSNRSGGGGCPLALLGAAAILLLPAAALARPVVVYPLDRTAVTTANINVYGAATEKVEVIKLRANEQVLIPFIGPNRTFEQSIRLRPGVNEIQVGGYDLRIAFVTPKQPAPEGFSLRPLHPAMLKGCGGCHNFEKPGNFRCRETGADMCLSCHANPALGKDKTTQPVGHSPVTDDRDCLVCHDPHGGVGKRHLVKDVPTLCFDCHDPVAGEKDRVHSPVADGDCLACHQPHASANPGLLVAKRDALCEDCHDDPTAGQAVPHDAMEEGCASCHDPHASPRPGLLIKPQVEVCGACHDVPRPAKGIVVHSPIADDGECTVCHSPHGGQAAKLLIKPLPGLCAECHDDVTAAGRSAGSVHSPAEEGSCGDCHKPHSGAPGLLAKAPSALCLDCHDRFQTPEKGSLHPPAGDGECAECHDPHAVPRKNLVREDGSEPCYECHDRFAGRVVHSPVDDGSCGDCHLPHVSVNKGLLVKDGMALCLDCHDDPSMILLSLPRSSLHGPIHEGRSCTPCHSPHAGNEKLLLAPISSLCDICHNNVMRKTGGREYAFRHTPVRDGGCLKCHRAHSAKESHLLPEESTKALCLTCHKGVDASPEGRAWKTPHPPVVKACLDCHLPHASDEKGVLRAPQSALCGKCHPDHSLHPLDVGGILEGKKSMAKMPVSFPIDMETRRMVCSGCHSVHGSDYVRMFNVPKDWLCRRCHAF